MRPALQRLLARPSTLEFLELLVGQPTRHRAIRGDRQWKRRSSDLALATRGYTPTKECIRCVDADSKPVEKHDSNASETKSKHGTTELGWLPRQPVGRETWPIVTPNKRLERSTQPGHWSSKSWTREELDFESDMTSPLRRRWLNQPEHQYDVELWTHLLKYRFNQYGDKGVIMFWNFIFDNGIWLPTLGDRANTMWYILLNLNFSKLPHGFLEKICVYADILYEVHNTRWAPNFYLQIMQYYLTVGRQDQALYWHRRMFKYHAPGRRGFLRLYAEIIGKDGNHQVLKTIYADGRYKKCYNVTIETLCARGKFRLATEWHFWLLQHNDLPSTPATVEPLLQYLVTYAPKSAGQVVASLQEAGIPYEVALTHQHPQITPRNSVDIISEVRSKTFHVTEKSYNDSLGARWLATGWIALSTAIEAINALGIREIGPLSLQSIAMREKDADAIASRIEQLARLNISIGQTCYSLAIASFAQDSRQDLLDMLLESDQHPSELEDVQLQERLLSHYAKSEQWTLFRLTLETLSVRSHSPEVQKRNILFRLSLQDKTAMTVDTIKENVNDMISEGFTFKYDTIVCIKRALMSPRQKGHRPDTLSPISPATELDNCISIFSKIMEANNKLPIYFWSEVVRRLGMLGYFRALETICLRIADWYMPGSRQLKMARVSSEVMANNAAHPLRQFFNESLQMAIVEWGFMHALDGRQPSSYPDPDSINSGIQLLEKLSNRGVWICHETIQKAILNRMMIYYGSGASNRNYNRVATERLTMSLRELASLIDYNFDGHTLSVDDIKEHVASNGTTRIQRRDRKVFRRVMSRARTRGE